MTVVDASVLIAFLDPNDAHHETAVDLLANMDPPLIVDPITAAEILVAPLRNGVADAVWADLIAIGVEIDRTPIDSWQLARIRVDTGCKLPDCCVLASAATHRAGIATLDERLRRHAASS